MKTKIPTMADYHKVLKEQGLGSKQKPSEETLARYTHVCGSCGRGVTYSNEKLEKRMIDECDEPAKPRVSLEELVFTALGQASMCWYQIPRGIFNSEEANKIGKKLIREIIKLTH